jgi:hypothetical protein
MQFKWGSFFQLLSDLIGDLDEINCFYIGFDEMNPNLVSDRMKIPGRMTGFKKTRNGFVYFGADFSD